MSLDPGVAKQNAELIRRYMRRADDPPPTSEDLEMYEPEIEVRPDSRWPEQRIYRGHDQLVRLAIDYWRAWEHVGYEWDEPVFSGDRAAVRFRHRVRGRESGAEVVNEASIVFTIRDRKIYRQDYYYDHDEALAALGPGSGPG